MAAQNTLIFVDLASDDPAAAGRFYSAVFGWQDDHRPLGLYHLGIFKAENARPHPEQAGVEPRHLSTDGRKPRIWILVGDGQSADDIFEKATARGATVLWRKHYWKEFNGFNDAFRDPWGNEIVLWTKAGPAPVIPDDYSRE
jgi:predicted enzyme related to lactoylglutathione lyase